MGKALFFIGSKGDVKEFFGMGVSEPDQSSVCFLWVPLALAFLHLSCGRQKATLGSFSGAGFWTGWA